MSCIVGHTLLAILGGPRRSRSLALHKMQAKIENEALSVSNGQSAVTLVDAKEGHKLQFGSNSGFALPWITMSAENGK